jgi:hypothetical protein
MGITFRALGLHDDAINAYSRAIMINPLYSDCFFNLGNIYFEDKKDV